MPLFGNHVVTCFHALSMVGMERGGGRDMSHVWRHYQWAQICISPFLSSGICWFPHYLCWVGSQEAELEPVVGCWGWWENLVSG